MLCRILPASRFPTFLPFVNLALVFDMLNGHIYAPRNHFYFYTLLERTHSFTSGNHNSQQMRTFVAKSQNKPDTFLAKKCTHLLLTTCSKTGDFEHVRPVLLIFRKS